MSVYNFDYQDHLKTKLFLDEQGSVSISRYDTFKYSQFDALTKQQMGFFWVPEEVDLSKDRKDFTDLTEFEKHIFTSNLKRQILLDSVQGRSPNMAFLPLVSEPSLETWIEQWGSNETVHSRSYTHIIRNIYPDPEPIFNEINTIPEILACATDISRNYDELIEYTNWYTLFGEGEVEVKTKGSKKPIKRKILKYELKKKLWMALMSVNILEGVRFYVSFACSWAFGELKKMEGNAKIIKLICRDENLHLGSTQTLLKILPKDDPDFIKIREETEADCIKMYMDAIHQEKEWADFLFKDGSMIGLNAQLVKEYVSWIGAKRMTAVGYKCPYKTTTANPLPWTESWISSKSVQVAAQEAEISSYIQGGINKDFDTDQFAGFKL